MADRKCHIACPPTNGEKKMTRKLLAVASCLMAMTTVTAQSITGKIVDAEGEPLAFANVVLLSRQDSTFVKGAVSGENGQFSIDSECNGGILKVTSIGYKTVFKDCEGENAGVIAMEEDSKMLGEVVVKSHLPKITLNGEGMSTIVEGSVLEKTSDMSQLLSRIPSVSAKDGQVEVFGRGTPVIYINGRKMQDNMDLQRLQPSDIKKIEVINNPGVRYDANVKSVIRITTKKPQGEGFSFDNKTSVSVDEDKDVNCYELFSANYRKGGLDVSGFLYGAYTRTPDDKRIQLLSYLATDTWRQTLDTEQKYKKLNPYARLGASYAFNENNSLGASVSYDRYAKNNSEGTQVFHTMQNDVLKESSGADYRSPGTSTAYYANAYYMGKIGSLKVDFNTDYYWYGKKERMNVYETVTDELSQTATSDVSTYRNSRNSMVASKLVMSVPLLKGSLSFGGEYSSVNRRMRYNVEPEVTDNENEKVKESMTSAFVDYSRAFGRLTAQVGLRYEYNDFNYYDNGLYVDDQSKTYGNWFPSLALSMPVGKTQMQLTYASDIYRPSYKELRSGVQYDNQYTYESGNPFLVPSIMRNLTYAFSWNWLNLQVIYSHISDEICTMTQAYQNDPMKTLMRTENIDNYNSFQSVLTLSPTFGVWHPSFEMTLYKQWLKMETHDGNRLYNPLAAFQLTNTFDFKWLTASLVMSAQTEGDMGNKHIRKGYFDTDLSFYKSLLKKRLALSLDVYDLFGTGDQHRAFYSGAQRTTVYDGYSTSSVTFSIRYRFNATNSKYKGTGAGQSQKSRM